MIKYIIKVIYKFISCGRTCHSWSLQSGPTSMDSIVLSIIWKIEIRISSISFGSSANRSSEWRFHCGITSRIFGLLNGSRIARFSPGFVESCCRLSICGPWRRRNRLPVGKAPCSQRRRKFEGYNSLQI